MKRSSQAGSHVIALALFVVFVAVVGFAGYKVWSMQQAAAPASSSTAANATMPSKITNTASLQQAASALDASAAQVNTNLDDSTLSADLNALL